MTVQKRGEIQALQIGYVVTCSAYLLFDFCFRAGATPTDYDENTSHAGVNTTSVEDSGDSKIAEDEGTPLGFILMFPSILYFAFGFISGPTQLSIASRCVANVEQERSQGANGSLGTTGKIVGPLLAAGIFKPQVDAGIPTLIFFVVSILVVPGVYVAREYLPASCENATAANVSSGKVKSFVGSLPNLPNAIES